MITNSHSAQKTTIEYMLSVKLRLFFLCTFLAYPQLSLGALPLFSISDLTYEGAFRLSSSTHGESSMSYAEGILTYNPDNNSLFVVGATNQQAIAEFPIPQLVKSEKLSDLNVSSSPIQDFSRVLNRAYSGNPQAIDRVGGLEYSNGQLFVNAYEYYDAPANNTHTTLAIRNARDIASSNVDGYFELTGAAHAAGWISRLPSYWQSILGATHISGQCGLAISTRLSIGPSGFVWNPEYVDTNLNQGPVDAAAILDFNLTNPLNGDLYNESGTNDIWTHISRATYGFVIPGTRTYATIGYSGGHDSGLGYKITQNTGYVCGGPCSYDSSDNYNFYWLWDLDDLVRVKLGQLQPHEVEPYDYGRFTVPFGTGTDNKIGGGTYDQANNLLYLSILKADNEGFHRGPVIIAFSVEGASTEGGSGGGSGGGSDGGSGGSSSALAAAPTNFSATVTVDSEDSSGDSGGDSSSSGGSDTSTSTSANFNPAFPSDAPPPLEIPSGTTVNVSSNSELQTAVSSLQDNTILRLAPGTYNLSNTLYIRKNNITLVGTGNTAEDVVLVGKGMDNASYGNVPHGIWSDATGLTITNLTIRDVFSHTIIFNPGAEQPHIYNVRLINSGEQFIKANPSGFGNGVDGGIVEYSSMEYTNGPPSTDHGGGGTGYTNGVDVHAGQNWIVRNNLFKNFHTPDSADNLWNPAILMWNGAAGTIAENNVFINVDRAIAFGLFDNASGQDHSGGIIRNNMIYYESGLYSSSRKTNSDAAIIVWDSNSTKVFHNTVLTNGNLNKSIEFRFATSGGEVRNNLVDATIGYRNNGTFDQSGNSSSAASNLFVDASAGNLHLSSSGANSVGEVAGLVDVPTDFDGESRGSNSEPGADSF